MSLPETPDLDRMIEQLPETAIDALGELIMLLKEDTAVSQVQGPSDLTFGRGEYGAVFMVDRPRPLVSKVSPAKSSLFEALVVQQLAAAEPAPLSVPQLLKYSPTSPGYAVFSKVGGETLSAEEHRSFTPDEKRAYGQKMGEFVAWMATAMNQAGYARIIEQVGGWTPVDRVDRITQCGQLARSGTGPLDQNLAKVLIDTEDQYHQLRAEGLMEPTLIGHDDLHNGNVTFKNQDGMRQAVGAIDFAITKPNTPERELRYTAIMGREAADAAVETYQQLTGQTLSRRLLRFWAIGQVATVCAYRAMNGLQEELAGSVKDLQIVLPERDWSGLATVLISK